MSNNIHIGFLLKSRQENRQSHTSLRTSPHSALHTAHTSLCHVLEGEVLHVRPILTATRTFINSITQINLMVKCKIWLPKCGFQLKLTYNLLTYFLNTYIHPKSCLVYFLKRWHMILWCFSSHTSFSKTVWHQKYWWVVVWSHEHNVCGDPPLFTWGIFE